MTVQDTTNVLAAFEMLLEEVESEIEFVNQAGSQAFGAGDYATVDLVRTQAAQLVGFREKAAALRVEWQGLSASLVSDTDETAQAERRNLGRLKRGTRTAEDAFRQPILSALVALGGSANLNDVLERVYPQVKAQLREVDYEDLPSSPGSPRWRNTAQWARNALVKEALMRADSQRGTWAISEAGRRFLQKQTI